MLLLCSISGLLMMSGRHLCSDGLCTVIVRESVNTMVCWCVARLRTALLLSSLSGLLMMSGLLSLF